MVTHKIHPQSPPPFTQIKDLATPPPLPSCRHQRVLSRSVEPRLRCDRCCASSGFDGDFSSGGSDYLPGPGLLVLSSRARDSPPP
jgi:hypothetical protein